MTTAGTGRAGQQQDQFVATAGGLNSVYTDVDAQAGDTMVVDLPWPSDLLTTDEAKKGVAHYDPSAPHGAVAQSRPWGFAHCATKKGIPKVGAGTRAAGPSRFTFVLEPGCAGKADARDSTHSASTG